jgi:hypothetical protein
LLPSGEAPGSREALDVGRPKLFSDREFGCSDGPSVDIIAVLRKKKRKKRVQNPFHLRINSTGHLIEGTNRSDDGTACLDAGVVAVGSIAVTRLKRVIYALWSSSVSRPAGCLGCALGFEEEKLGQGGPGWRSVP